MKNKFYLLLIFTGMLAGVGCLTSCGDDDETFLDPTLSLSETAVTAAPGEDITITATVTTDAAFKSLVVTKLWDGASQGTENFDKPTGNELQYTYTIIDDDADHVLSLNFTVTDDLGRTASVDVVITVELTPLQILLKYDWRLNDEIRARTNASDINDLYNDDVYRFNENGTYQKSIGAKADNFRDLITNYCFYDLNETTMRLLMSTSENFLGTDAVDTLDIIVLDDTKLHADVTYYGLDEFNEEGEEVPYLPIEDYEKQFVAVAKTDSFDPYNAGNEVTNEETGATDDDGPGVCRDVVLEND
ncbi:hypothetical protein FNH22_10685 [Fulvivirga sp. M361]|uniref:hypothetical protein n=1 Tax=Fulvivirga sp. M361 TaxID=2594266 RepID=UPI00117A3F14|nr:hypothetical protein [Fulvivirga sp. M361]TRX59603.1 hypothetical protein FNH22_10685 [Fulvivirga sp. M361]